MSRRWKTHKLSKYKKVKGTCTLKKIFKDLLPGERYRVIEISDSKIVIADKKGERVFIPRGIVTLDGNVREKEDEEITFSNLTKIINYAPVNAEKWIKGHHVFLTSGRDRFKQYK